MKPTVFISHSCKDHEREPPVGLSQAEATERNRRLQFARQLREDVHAALSRNQEISVFLDVRGGLQAGDVWRVGLHQNLRNCAGAVVLLTPESLQSGWVLKEATILSWRVFLGESLIMVPVVYGITDEEIKQRGFGALDLDAIQWVRVRDASRETRIAAVQEITAALANLETEHGQTGWNSTAERWLVEFADNLKSGIPDENRDAYLDAMWLALNIDPAGKDYYGEQPFLAIATQVLASTPQQILNLLYEAARTRPKPDKEVLAGETRPLWIDPTAACRLHLAAQQGRLVAINATEVETAREYVRRAFCNKIRWDQILIPTDVASDVTDEILERIRDYLAEYVPIEDSLELRNHVRDNGAVFVILGPGLIRDDVLRSLTENYKPLTFVAVTGPNVARRLGHWSSKAMLLRPTLQPNRESGARRYRNQLKAFVTGQT